MSSDIRELASILDEEIEKGELIERKQKGLKKSVAAFEEEISKAMSFNPEALHVMSEGSPYYNPYKMLGDGTFVPYPKDYWVSQGAPDDGWETVDAFFQTHGVERPEPPPFPVYQPRFRPQSDSSFRSVSTGRMFRRSMSEQIDLIKGTKLPIGTVHLYNGQKFKKVGEGDWRPVTMPHAPRDIEGHASRVARLKELIEKKTASEGDKKKKGEKKQKSPNRKQDESQALKTEPQEGITPDLTDLKKKLARSGGRGGEIRLERHELTAVLQHGKYAFVSAGRNPKDAKEKELTDEQIKVRYEILRKKLVETGHQFTPVKGFYDGEEDSFLVMAHDADREEMIKLGEELNQDSIIYGESGVQEMHFTTGENKGKAHVGKSFEPRPDANNYYSVLKDSAGDFKFALNFDFSSLVDSSDIKANKHRDAFSDDGRVIETKVTKFAPGDGSRPNNGLGPPPPENKIFVMPGVDVKAPQVEAFIEAFKPDYVEMFNLGTELKYFAGATHFANRLKDRSSLLDKMHGRLKDRSLNTVTDVIGGRALAHSLDNQKDILQHLKDNFEMVEVDDFSEKGRSDGYRAVHLLLKTKSGKIAEMQIKTHRQQIFSGFTHDTIYKPQAHLKSEFAKDEEGQIKNQEVGAYLTALSDYLFKLDQGGKDDPKARPTEPDILVENNIFFPWHEVDAVNKGDYSKFDSSENKAKQQFEEFSAKNPVKHYVVIRDENNRNTGLHEFDDFKQAEVFVNDLRDSGHSGQLPMGYAHSKKEFLRVFSEYQPNAKKEEIKKSGSGKPVGTIHVSPDGRKWQKTQSGKWVEVSDHKKSDLNVPPESIFNISPDTTILDASELRHHRDSPEDAEHRSYKYAMETVRGKHPKRDPLTVWKVNRADGSHYHSIRDGSTTFQMLKNRGWSKFPVKVEREVAEEGLAPVQPHQPQSTNREAPKRGELGPGLHDVVITMKVDGDKEGGGVLTRALKVHADTPEDAKDRVLSELNRRFQGRLKVVKISSHRVEGE